MEHDILASELFSAHVIAAARVQEVTTKHFVRLLTEFYVGRHHIALGYATIGEYADKKLGMQRKQARELVRIGRALLALPLASAALDADELTWTAAREIVRVATPATEAAWLARAAACSSRELEREVAATSPGQPPPSEGKRPLVPVRGQIRFDVESVDAEVIRRALASMRFHSELDSTEIEDGALLREMAELMLRHLEARFAAGQPAKDGAAGSPPTGGSPEPSVSPEPSASSEPAASLEPAASPEPPTAVSSERYRVVLEYCPGCRELRCGDAEVSDTVASEAACDCETVDMRPGPNQGHLTRTIPPKVRRIVFHRARGRCEVPGCTNGIGLDIHHSVSRADGGTHDPRNLCLFCGAHHRAVHDGVLAAERLATGAVRVTHANGRTLTGPVPLGWPTWVGDEGFSVGARPGSPPPLSPPGGGTPTSIPTNTR